MAELDAAFSPTLADETVLARTGKGWDEWFAELDAAGARELDHTGIAAHLAATTDISSWWCQAVTVNYEQARGMRDRYQLADGYAASASKTIAVSQRQLFDAINDESIREAWLPQVPTFDVRSSTAPRTMRIEWHDGSRVVIAVLAKAADKSQVTFQHTKLAHAEAAERAKAEWRAAAHALKLLLEA